MASFRRVIRKVCRRGTRIGDGTAGVVGGAVSIRTTLLLFGVVLALPPHALVTRFQIGPGHPNFFAYVVVGWGLLGFLGAIGTLFSRRWGLALLAAVHAPALLGGWTRSDLALTAWCGSRVLGLGPPTRGRRGHKGNRHAA